MFGAKLRKVYAGIALATALTFTVPWLAFADNVGSAVVISSSKIIDSNGNAQINYTVGDPGIEVRYYIQATGSGGGGNSCDTDASDPATVTINVPAHVHASQTSLTFTACGSSTDNYQTVFFTADADDGGTPYLVTTTTTGGVNGASFNDNTAKFHFHVSAAPVTCTTPDAPTISPLPSAANGQNGWFVTAPALTATTSTGATVYWSTNGGASWSAIAPALSDGVTTVEAYAQSDTVSDCASGTVSETYYVDTTPPTITFVGASPAANANGWNKSAVTLTWSCGDGTSGPVNTQVQQTLSSEGRNLSAKGTCFDRAGLSASDTEGGDGTKYNIDETAPNLNVSGPANGATLDVCAAITRPSFNPTDPNLGDGTAGSGVDLSSTTLTGDSWTTPPVLGLGAYTYHAWATDHAGNLADETRTYSATTYGSARSGFLSPIGAAGKRVAFKLGSTIPLKFQLMCGQTPITNAAASLTVTRVSPTPSSTNVQPGSSGNANSGNAFRYDPSGKQYIFNMSTKVPLNSTSTAWTAGDWTLTATLAGTGETISTTISLVK